VEKLELQLLDDAENDLKRDQSEEMQKANREQRSCVINEAKALKQLQGQK
jgi:hypothetical protein